MASVELPIVLIVGGEKEQLKPTGSTGQVRLTTPSKRAKGSRLIVAEASPPGAAVNTEGNAVKAMSGGAAMAKAMVTVRTIAPETPCTDIGKLPIGVTLLVVSVRMETPAPVTVGGVKAAVTPTGSPLADSRTVLLKPPRVAILIVNGSAAADVICAEEGPEMEKSGA